LIGLVLLVVLVYRLLGLIQLKNFSGYRLLESVRGARWEYLLLSVMAIYICYALRALRWQRLSRYLGACHFGSVCQMTLAGFASIFLLGRAGEPVRPLLIARKEKLPVSGMFGIYLLERLIDPACVAILAVSALALFPVGGHHARPREIERYRQAIRVLLLVGIVVAAALLLYFRLHGGAYVRGRLERWRARGGGWARFSRAMTGLIHGLRSIRTVGDLIVVTAYSVAHWLLVALIYLWVPMSLGGRLATIRFTGAMLVLAITMLGSMALLPGVGGGPQTAAVIAFTTIFGVEQEPAAAAAILLWLVTFAACTLAGVPILIREGLSIGQLLRLAEREESEVKEANLSGASRGESS
jgi:hypothetical protein